MNPARWVSVVVFLFLLPMVSVARTETEDLRIRMEQDFHEQGLARLRIRNETELPKERRELLMNIHNRQSIQHNERSVRDYLKSTGTAFEEKGAVGDKRFEIFGVKEGSWLNRVAWDLLAEVQTSIIIRPSVIMQDAYGLYHLNTRNIDLVLPPWRGAPTEFLSHESYHAVIMSAAVLRGMPHFLSGYIENPKELSTTYAILDFSEIGAYLETLKSIFEIQVSGLYSEDEIWALLGKYYRNLNVISSAIVNRFTHVASGPLENLTVIRLKEKQGVDLMSVDADGAKMFSRNFGMEIARGDSQGWVLSDTPMLQQGALQRLRVQRDLFIRFQSRLADLQRLFEVRNLGLLRVRVRQLSELLVDLNQEWLGELKIKRGTEPYQIEINAQSLIRRQRDCQSLLIARLGSL